MADFNEFNRRVIDEFRSNAGNGKVGAPFANAAMLLLTTTGAKTGKSFTTHPCRIERQTSHRLSWC